MVRVAVDDPIALRQVVAALRAGDAVVIPTETVYGVAALPAHQERLLALKGRPSSVPIAVLVADGIQAAGATGLEFTEVARRLVDAFWPGPLTLVLPTFDGGTLGVRCPDHAFVRAVTAEVGPIATTSANRHGAPTPATAAAAAADLAGSVAVVVDGGSLTGLASTVVDVTGDDVVILREGALDRAAIGAAIG